MRFNYQYNEWIETENERHKLAVAGSDGDLTWVQFVELVERVEERLKSIAIPAGHPIIIYGHKEKLFPAAIAACMRLSIPYVPVDIIYPHDRIARVKELTSSDCVIYCSDKKLDLDFAFEIDHELGITKKSETWFSTVKGFDINDPIRYIIFTSGSTGEPKGVQITNSAVCSFIGWIDGVFHISKNEVLINQAPFSFDLSVYELTFFLHYGATLILNDGATCKNAELFLTRINRYGGSLWVSTPSFAYIYLRERVFNEVALPSLNYFLFCGETLPTTTAKKLYQLFPSSKVVNTYGPTEATVATTYVLLDEEMIEKYSSLPVGVVKADSQIILENPDESGVGEMVIIGDNVSIGYIGRDDLNKDRFLMVDGKRAYRTGDQGYYQDGMLFYLGRNDDQIKLNGYRIELDEISEVLKAAYGVSNASSIALKVNNVPRKIVAFVTAKSGFEVNPSDVKYLAAQKLPAYMVPDDIVVIDQLPLNDNSKTDKKKLEAIYLGRNS